MPSASPNLQTIHSYIESLSSISAPRILAHFHPTLEHRILPASLGRPVLKFEGYAEYFKSTIALLKKFKVTISEVVEERDKIAIHASSVGESIFGTPYHNEYMCIFHLLPPVESEAGDAAFPDLAALPKISLMKEFVDSAYSATFFAGERAKAAAAAAQ